MSENASFYHSRSCTTGYRQGRRRWVPKGVALLVILFVVGLLGACQSSSQPVAAIAVPVDTTQSDDADGLAQTASDSSWMVASVRDGMPGRRVLSALNTF